MERISFVALCLTALMANLMASPIERRPASNAVKLQREFRFPRIHNSAVLSNTVGTGDMENGIPTLSESEQIWRIRRESSSSKRKPTAAVEANTCSSSGKRLQTALRVLRSVQQETVDGSDVCSVTVLPFSGQVLSERDHRYGINFEAEEVLQARTGSLYAQVLLDSQTLPDSVMAVLNIEGERSARIVPREGSRSICLDFDVSSLIKDRQFSSNIAFKMDLFCKFAENKDFERCGFRFPESPFLVISYLKKGDLNNGCTPLSFMDQI